VDKKTLQFYKRLLGNPNTVEDFVEIFNTNMKKNTSSLMICFKLIEKMFFITILTNHLINSETNITQDTFL
jgi:hypothetical protein